MNKLLLSLVFIIAIHNLSAQQIIYVDKGAAGSNDGTTWANAYTEVQDALNAAPSGSEIWVKAGTYYPDNGTDRTKTFELKNGVKLFGGFAGSETVLDQRNFNTNVTILSGNIGNTSLKTDNSYHVVSSTGNDRTAIIDGFTVTDGYIGAGSLVYGAGIVIMNSSPVIKNCIFSNHTTLDRGGAVYSQDSSPLFEGCTFQGNSANKNGGAVYIYQGIMTIKNSIFQNNVCLTSDCQGGAIYNGTADLIIENSIFRSNTSTSFGGAIRNGFGKMRIENTKFKGNTANSNGGAIYSYSGTPNYIGCIFNHNSSGKGGAIAHYSIGLSKVTNCAFYNNSASVGGGLYSNNGGSRVTNCIFWKNNDLNGEVLASQIKDESGTSSLIKNSIVQGITASIINGNLNSDPLFESPLTYDFRLQIGSPAIDAGIQDTTNLTLPGSDIDGNPRVVNNRIDIGPYEGALLTALTNPLNSAEFCTVNYVNKAIRISFTESEKYEISIFDLSGKVLYSDSFTGDEISIPVEPTSPHMYLLNISNYSGGKLSSEKLFIRDY